MAITFLGQRKKQKYLIIFLIIIVLTILLVVWCGFFMESKTPASPETLIFSEPIKIEWGLFENPVFQEFQPYPEIIAFEPYETEEGEIGVGRENPFILY